MLGAKQVDNTYYNYLFINTYRRVGCLEHFGVEILFDEAKKKTFGSSLQGLQIGFFSQKLGGCQKNPVPSVASQLAAQLDDHFHGVHQLSAEACHPRGQHWFHPTFAPQPFRRLPIHFGGDHLLRRAAATG